jgi:cytochrome c oxidase subunit 2
MFPMHTDRLPLADANASFFFPEQASTFAPRVDTFFHILVAISVVFFAIVVVGMIYFAIKYRMRAGYAGSTEALHNTPLEITWTVIPTLIVIWIFYEGAMGYLDMSKPPAADTFDVQVQAQKWAWTFTYPNGAISDELHLAKGQAAKMIMRSSDVIHSLYVPAFRAKCDVVPGRFSVMWFEPTKLGTYDLFCAEYCGDQHSEMLAKVFVHEPEELEEWLVEAASPPVEDPVAHGEWLYERVGCKACHSIDGSSRVGPSFLGTWGKSVPLSVGGAVEFDENYVRESILYPPVKYRSGYEQASAMPSYQGRLKENELDAITAFLKSLGQ